ncbi:hypothetical protein PMAYCL1PPCAC_20813, partial [Pristionchus mayeri]
WVNAVRSTAEERISLLKVVNNKAFISFLCPSHFSPSDYIQCANRSILRPDAIPFFDVNTAQPSQSERFITCRRQEDNCSRNIAKETINNGRFPAENTVVAKGSHIDKTIGEEPIDEPGPSRSWK